MISTLTKNKTNLQMSATARRDHPTIPFWENRGRLGLLDGGGEEQGAAPVKREATIRSLHSWHVTGHRRPGSSYFCGNQARARPAHIRERPLQRTVPALRKMHPRTNLDHATGEQQCSNHLSLCEAVQALRRHVRRLEEFPLEWRPGYSQSFENVMAYTLERLCADGKASAFPGRREMWQQLHQSSKRMPAPLSETRLPGHVEQTLHAWYH